MIYHLLKILTWIFTRFRSHFHRYRVEFTFLWRFRCWSRIFLFKVCMSQDGGIKPRRSSIPLFFHRSFISTLGAIIISLWFHPLPLTMSILGSSTPTRLSYKYVNRERRSPAVQELQNVTEWIKIYNESPPLRRPQPNQPKPSPLTRQPQSDGTPDHDDTPPH
jgi:hypothetical protein